MCTKDIIKSLRDVHSSEFNKLEALFTLTKHNVFTSIRDSLILCYINEDIEGAIRLVNIELDKQGIKITTGRTIYTLSKNSIAKQKADSRGTMGYQMTTVGGDTEWLRAMDILEYRAKRKELLSNKEFLIRFTKLKSILKRKARLSANRVSKTGKVTKYKRRELPTKRG